MEAEQARPAHTSLLLLFRWACWYFNRLMRRHQVLAQDNAQSV
jgi:hypothetical protein